MLQKNLAFLHTTSTAVPTHALTRRFDNCVTCGLVNMVLLYTSHAHLIKTTEKQKFEKASKQKQGMAFKTFDFNILVGKVFQVVYLHLAAQTYLVLV